jgi:hypothetical protein
MSDLSIHLTLLLDRSGSMLPLRGAVVSGVNELLRDQRRVEEPCRVTVALFSSDDPLRVVRDAVVLGEVPDLTLEDFHVGGLTPLHDALWAAIERAAARGVPGERQIVVTFTDGEENASHRVRGEALRERVRALAAEGWGFEFFGADQDAALAGGRVGIDLGSAHAFSSSAAGTLDAFRHASLRTHSHRDRLRAQHRSNQSPPDGQSPDDGDWDA